MAIPVFWNEIQVGPGLQNFSINAGACTITAGTYSTFREFRNAFMTAAQTSVATLRSGLSSTGHFTLDNNGGANFTVTFTDIAIGYLLGYTGSIAIAGQSWTGSRRIGASLYLEHGGGPTAATIGEHDPKPGLVHVSQTEALSGLRRTTRSGVQRKRAAFSLQFLDNTALYVTPSSATGTTYAANAGAAFDIGLTQYAHAKERWYDSTRVEAQGWSDGRRIRYFPDSATTTYALTAAAWSAPAATAYSDWVADETACAEFSAEKARPPQTTKYHWTIPVWEYLT